MVSTNTLNRQRKLKMLREVINKTLDLTELEHKDRDKINMKYYKEFIRQIEIMQNLAKTP